MKGRKDEGQRKGLVRITLMIIVGRPIPSPTPIAILSLPERSLVADEVDVVSEVDDGGVTSGLVVVGDNTEGVDDTESVDDKPAEEDEVPELELPCPARHSYLTRIPFAMPLLVVFTSTHCSA